MDSQNLDRVIKMEMQILGPVPYRGNGIELETGLFSVKSVDYADRFLTFLEKASGLAGIAYATVALPYVRLIKDGVDMILDNQDSSILEIGLSRSFSKPETGYFIVMRAPKNQVKIDELRVDPNDFRLVDSNSKPISDYPYMVFKVTASQEREDWFEVPEISSAYNKLMEDVRNNRYSDTQDSMNFFRRIALTSPDFIDRDSSHLVKEVQEKVNAVMGPTATSLGKKRSLPDLRDIPLYST